jgi:RNA polymerase sigma-70 factor, ECF subfamily
MSDAAAVEYRALQGSSDEELMIHLLAGHHDALAVIVDRYQRLVWSVAKRIVHDAGEAEDLVQIVFLELFKKVDLFDPGRGTLKVWILQLAYTKSINRRYHLQRRRFYDQAEVHEEEVALFVRRVASPFRLSTGETSRLIGEVLVTLNPNQRTAVELISFEGLTFEELATRTSETVSNAKHHYYRGMMKLREVLSEKAGQLGQSKGQGPARKNGGANA